MASPRTADGVSSATKERGLIVAERSYPEADVTRYTSDPIGYLNAQWWGLQVTLFVSVEPVSSRQTRVTVQANVMGRTSQISPSAKRSGLTIVPLRSSGTIERRVLEGVGEVSEPPASR